MKSIVLDLDSTNRDADSTIQMPNWSLNQSVQNIRSVKVKTLSLPVSWYNVEASNNQIYFTNNGGTPVVATIPVGQYDILQLDAAIALAMATADTVYTYTVSTNLQTAIMSVTINAGTFEFTFGTNTANSASELMGFVGNSASALATQSGNGIVQLQGVERVFLVLRDFFVESPVRVLVPGTILSIPVQVPFGGIIQYSDNEDQGKYFTPTGCNSTQNLQVVRLGLYYQNGTPLPLRNGNWHASISFEYIAT